MLLKIKCDLRSRYYKHNAAKFLDETFGDMLDDDKFLRWLAKSLDYKTFQFKKILESYREEIKSRRHTLSDN